MEMLLKWQLNWVDLPIRLLFNKGMLLLLNLTCDSEQKLPYRTGPSRTCIIVGVKNGVDNKNTGDSQNHVQHCQDLMAYPILSSRHMALTKVLQSYSVPDCKAKVPVSAIACLWYNQYAIPARHVGPAQPPVELLSVLSHDRQISRRISL